MTKSQTKAKPVRKTSLNRSRDIPYDMLELSQKNVRRVKNGVTIQDLADDIYVRGILTGLNVRPILDDQGVETGRFRVPAGGRRFLAVGNLIKRGMAAKTIPIPCVVKDDDGSSEREDSYAENFHREKLHPLDEFRAMHDMVVTDSAGIETIAARFKTSAAVVRQRLRLAAVSPKLLDVYAADGMTYDQLVAFSVNENHARQEQVWELLAHSYNKSASYIREKLTENSIHARDRRVRFVGLDAYREAGGYVMTDLFQQDGGGWIADPALLDRLVSERLQAEGETVAAEGWKWVAVAVDLPFQHARDLRPIEGERKELTKKEQARVAKLEAELEAIEIEHEEAGQLTEEAETRWDAIEAELAALVDRPLRYVPAEMAIAGAFVSIDHNGGLVVDRGYVRPEDEPAAEDDETAGAEEGETDADGPQAPTRVVIALGGDDEEGDEEETDALKPLPDRIVTDLTAYRTLALQNAVASQPKVAYVAALHALALSTFTFASRESCVDVSRIAVSFPMDCPGLKGTAPDAAIKERHQHWKDRLPKDDKALWDAIVALDEESQAALFAHCVSYAVSALWEPVRYEGGRISKQTIERRIAHSHVLARAVTLDLADDGWRPTVDNFLGRVTKGHILAAVTEALGPQKSGLIDHLKKPDMAREAERLLADTDWLPEPMRTPALEEAAEALPAFLEGDAPDADAGAADSEPDAAVAA